MKLLLTSVFGPFGVDDAYGRKENVMELFHNQVTREQGVFSPRMNHDSYGLHLMAENLTMPAVVLDFPSQSRFLDEVKKGYDYIGISFIVPNFLKARKMARMIREASPRTKIILGGHGTSIEGVEKSIPCDHVCRGEGIRFLRRLFNEDEDAALTHPALYASFNKHILGVPVKPNAGMIMTGVGCSNACRFCCTSHFFDKAYTPFFKTGKEIYDVCARIEKKLGVTEFFILDENFLKSEIRARELLHEMEKNNKVYSFSVFSSAEAVTALGIDMLQRLGINFLWIGVESKKEVYEKNRGIDFKILIKSLRDHGISVLASGILFLEHHDKETIHEDIAFITGLNADLVQFMQVGPLPGTRLFDEYEGQGKLRDDIPYEEWHGQHQIWFTHPHFTRAESAGVLKQAFITEFETNGPSFLRMADTAIRGAEATQKHTSGFMRLRHEQLVERAREFYPTLDAMCSQAPDQNSRRLAMAVRRRFNACFGRRPAALRAKSLAVQGLMLAEKFRSRVIQNNLRQPKTTLTSYRMGKGQIMKKIGAHVSAGGGVENAPLNARDIGAGAFAFFTKNQRQWRAKPLSLESIKAFKNNCENAGYAPQHILPHDGYLINLGHPEKEGLDKSRAAFLDEMQRCEQLELETLNFHPGSHLRKISPDECLERIVESIDMALENTKYLTAVIENTAGQGTNMGYRFEHLAFIISRVRERNRIGVCLDTAHTFAAGYDLTKRAAYDDTWDAFDRIVGFEYLRGVHLNDSKKELGSRVDRHECIGRGRMGIRPFQFLMRDKRFGDIPMILETPESANWAEEIKMLQGFEVISTSRSWPREPGFLRR